MAPGVRQAEAELVGCVVLVDLREAVEQTLEQCADYPWVSSCVHKRVFKLTK